MCKACKIISRHTITITADRKRGRTSKQLVWTTCPPVTARIGPENIMTKPEKLSAEAEVAETEGDIWSLFFTQQVCCSGFSS
jgi:hypothetical protein